MRRVYVVPLLTVVLLLAIGATAITEMREQARRLAPGVQPGGSILTPTNQELRPVGKLVTFEGARPKDLALSPNGQMLAMLTTEGLRLLTSDGEETGSVPFRGGALGIAWLPDSSAVYASAENGRIHRVEQTAGRWVSATSATIDLPGERPQGQPSNPQVNGLAISSNGKRLYAALGIRNAVAVLKLPELSLERSISVGAAPYHLLLSEDGRRLFVANRGGTLNSPGQTEKSAGTPVVTNSFDGPRSGTVTIADTETWATRKIEVGRQPAGIALSKDGMLLFVALADEDEVAVVDAVAGRLLRRSPINPPSDAGYGQIPTDVAFLEDEKRLLVACGGASAVAVFSRDTSGRPAGFLPSAWYPVAIEAASGRFYVACSKGLGARRRGRDGSFGVHGSVGILQIVPFAALRDLAKHTRAVASANRWRSEPAPRAGIGPVPVPERVGEPSVFRHVVYIIKENQTYDSVLGDIKEGNGDPRFCMYGEEVTPNHHALAREFVLLDNTYTSGTNSADGHQWSASSIANDYVERNYGVHVRSYPYDGGDPLAYSPAGFLWNAVEKTGRLSVRVYGEFVNRPRIRSRSGKQLATWENLWKDYKSGANDFEITASTDQATLRPHLHPNYIGFPSTVSDQWRADRFIEDLAGFEKSGKMPSLSILLLPNDHTAGTRPSMPTPRATVADNDLALGRIVERISKSRFWKETLILVIEDDSQHGVDHVDGHRTVAFCISPYTRRGAVVSEMYNHTSFIRTMGLALGFPALNRFDRTATPLRACFQQTPDFTPYKARLNRIPLDEMNPRPGALRGEARRLAEACSRIDLSDVDRAHAETITRANWHVQMIGRPFPEAHYDPPEDQD